MGFVGNLLLFAAEFCKSIKKWQSYSHGWSGTVFFWLTVYKPFCNQNALVMHRFAYNLQKFGRGWHPSPLIPYPAPTPNAAFGPVRGATVQASHVNFAPNWHNVQWPRQELLFGKL